MTVSIPGPSVVCLELEAYFFFFKSFLYAPHSAHSNGRIGMDSYDKFSSEKENNGGAQEVIDHRNSAQNWTL